MSKKGLNFEEKKHKMLQLFHEKNEFFQLKELEKIAPKEKGIVANSVKEVVQALVNDGAVDTDKIGSSIYFWSFPSNVENSKKRKMEDLQTRFEMATKKLKLINKSFESLENENTNNENLDSLIEEVEMLEKRKQQLEKEFQKIGNKTYSVSEIEQQIQPVKEATNRWTDNIFAVKSWCKKKFMVEEKVLNKQFGIPEDLDYLE